MMYVVAASFNGVLLVYIRTQHNLPFLGESADSAGQGKGQDRSGGVLALHEQFW